MARILLSACALLALAGCGELHDETVVPSPSDVSGAGGGRGADMAQPPVPADAPSGTPDESELLPPETPPVNDAPPDGAEPEEAPEPEASEACTELDIIVGETIPACGNTPNLVTNLPLVPFQTTFTDPPCAFPILDLTAIAPCGTDAEWGMIEVALFREDEPYRSYTPVRFRDVFRHSDISEENPLRFEDEARNLIGLNGPGGAPEVSLIGTPFRVDPYEAPLRIPARGASRLRLIAELRDDAPPGTYTVNLRTVNIFFDDLHWWFEARTNLGVRVVVTERR